MDENFQLKRKIENIDLLIFEDFQYFFEQSRGYLWECAIINSNKVKRIATLSSGIDDIFSMKEWFDTLFKRETLLIDDKIVKNLQHFLLHLTNSKYEERRASNNKLPYLCKNKKLALISGDGEVNEKFLKECLYSSLILNRELLRGQGMINYTLDIVVNNKEMLPASFICFSIEKCENFALVGAEHLKEFKYTEEEIMVEINEIIQSFFRKIDIRRRSLIIENEISKSPYFDNLVKCARKGISWYHSGMIPIFKYIVEILHEKRIINVVFCTETFPLKCETTIFTSITKNASSGGCIIKNFDYLQILNKCNKNVIYLPSLYNRHVENYNIQDANKVSGTQTSVFKRLIKEKIHEHTTTYYCGLNNVIDSIFQKENFGWIKNICKRYYNHRRLDFSCEISEEEKILEKFIMISHLPEPSAEDIQWFRHKESDKMFMDKVCIYYKTKHAPYNIKKDARSSYNASINLLRDLSFIGNDGILTPLGECARISSGNIEFIPLILLLNSTVFLSMKNCHLAACIALFIHTEFRNISGGENIFYSKDYHYYLLENKESLEILKNYEKISLNYGFRDQIICQNHLGRNIYLSNVVAHWIKNPKHNILDFSFEHKVYPGILLKCLCRVQSVLKECAYMSKILSNEEVYLKMMGAASSMGDFKIYLNTPTKNEPD